MGKMHFTSTDNDWVYVLLMLLILLLLLIGSPPISLMEVPNNNINITKTMIPIE